MTLNTNTAETETECTVEHHLCNNEYLISWGSRLLNLLSNLVFVTRSRSSYVAALVDLRLSLLVKRRCIDESISQGQSFSHCFRFNEVSAQPQDGNGSTVSQCPKLHVVDYAHARLFFSSVGDATVVQNGAWYGGQDSEAGKRLLLRKRFCK